MAQWWRSLNGRERVLLGLGFPALLALMFYFYLWEPAWQQRARLISAVPEQRATLAWMQHRLAGMNPVSEQASASADDQPLLTIIERAAISARVADTIQRVQPSSDGAVEIWFQEAIADNLLRWIEQLATLGIVVESATITRASAGKVSSRIKLDRS